MIRVGIIGATGYAGNELVRILLGHKEAEIVWYGSRSYVNENYADIMVHKKMALNQFKMYGRQYGIACKSG